MTDFHTHVLPKLDDGAKTVEVAAAMLSSAKDQGVKTVLATSHYYGKMRSPEEFIELRNNSYELLKGHIPEGMTVKLGAEVYLSERPLIVAEDIHDLCIEGTDYLLIELPFVKKFSSATYQKVTDIVAERGCVPVLAHVDRYAAFIDHPKRLLEFISLGCLLQVNASAFLEKHTKGFAMTLLKKGYVHAIGTDMHDDKVRASDMAAAKEAVEAEGLGAEWQAVQERMRAMLAGERVDVTMPKPIVKIFGKFH